MSVWCCSQNDLRERQTWLRHIWQELGFRDMPLDRGVRHRVSDDPADIADEALMTRVVGGDRRAFEILAHRHTRRALGLSYRIVGDLGTGEDIVQEALLRVWHNRARWDGSRGRFKPWFDRIVVNLSIDSRRRPRPVLVDEPIQRIDERADTLALLQGAALSREIHTGLNALPTRQRVALAMIYTEDMTSDEVAEAMGISKSSLESLLVRGRRKLKSYLTMRGMIGSGENS